MRSSSSPNQMRPYERQPRGDDRGDSPSSATGFDYDRLIASTRKRVKQEADSIRRLLAQTSTNIVQIGIRLHIVRTDIGPERFQDWLKAEFQWSQPVASNYMRAAAVFRDVDNLDRFQPSALYALARKKVPEAARREAIDRAGRGELITKRTAQAIVAKYIDQEPSGELQDQLHQVRHYVRRVSRKLRQEEVEQLVAELLRLARELQSSNDRRPKGADRFPASRRGPAARSRLVTSPCHIS